MQMLQVVSSKIPAVCDYVCLRWCCLGACHYRQVWLLAIQIISMLVYLCFKDVFHYAAAFICCV